MKKIKTRESICYDYVKLYYNHIEQIYNIIFDDNKNVVVIANKFILDNLNELKKEEFKRIHEFRISSDNLTFELKGLRNSIVIDDSYKVKPNHEIKQEIREILDNQERFIFSNITLISNIICTIILAVFITLIFATPMELNSIFIPMASIPFISLSSILLRDNIKSKIYNFSKEERPSFWKRNKDDLVKNLIFLLIGTAIGYYVK